MKHSIVILIALVLLCAFLYLRKKEQGLTRQEKIDFLNRFVYKDYTKLSDEELGIVYAISKQISLDVKPSSNMIAQFESILKKHNISYLPQSKI